MARRELWSKFPARNAHETNTLNILKLADALRTISDAKNDYVDALYGYERAMLNLENAAGQSIKN